MLHGWPTSSKVHQIGVRPRPVDIEIRIRIARILFLMRQCVCMSSFFFSPHNSKSIHSCEADVPIF